MTRVEEFEAEIESRLRVAADRPESLLADIAIARVFGRVLYTTPDTREPTPDSPLLAVPSGPQVTDERAALTELEKSFVVYEVPLPVLRPLHASFLAGVVPLVAGSRAYETLAAYAQVVCAGYVHWVTVSPGCLEPFDLFGRIDSSSGRFIPAQGDLAAFLRRARAQDSMHLVVLDGITRAGVDSCLLPLLDCTFDAMRGIPARELRLLPHDVNTLSGADYGLGNFRWPSNVLLAGIVRQGGSSFAPPDELWTRATFLMPDLCVQSVCRPDSIHPDVWAAQRQSLPTTRVPASAWAEWQRDRQAVTLNDHAKFWSAPNAPRVERGVRDIFLRVFAASCGSTQLANAGLHDAVSMTLLPVLRTNPDAVAALWDAAGCLYPDSRFACEKAVDWLG